MPFTESEIADIRRRAQFGLPLDIAEQRTLVEMLTGPLPSNKRCPTCEGEGYLRSEQREAGVLSHECPTCGGRGYRV